MSQYDVAIGMNQATLGQGISELYANSQARDQLFKGTQSGMNGSLAYTVAWDLQAAPTFTLSPPADDVWKDSIDDQGQNPKPEDKPQQNAFQLVLPQFYGQYTLGTAPAVSGTTKVIVSATVAIQGSQATITPLAVWIDETDIKGWNKFILNQVILVNVLKKAREMLAGLNIPPLAFSSAGVSIRLTPPQVTIGNNQLVVGASLEARGSVDISGVQWPDQPLFLLMSADLLQQVAQDLAQSQLVGHQMTGHGDYKSVMSYSWTAKVDSVDSITSSADDRTKLSAKVGIGFEATLKPLGGPCAISAATSHM